MVLLLVPLQIRARKFSDLNNNHQFFTYMSNETLEFLWNLEDNSGILSGTPDDLIEIFQVVVLIIMRIIKAKICMLLSNNTTCPKVVTSHTILIITGIKTKNKRALGRKGKDK